MAEIDRIVVLDIERDGSSSTTAEQEMVILRNDLASTDPTKGAGMVGYRSSKSYSDETVGKALTDIENNMSAVEDSASQALTKSNEALAKATTAESKIDNALLKGNNLSDLTNKVAALENIGAVPSEDIVLDPTAGKTPKAGDDGKIGMNWVRDLEYELSNIQRDIEKIEYPDGIVPFIDWDFTSGQLPSNFMFRRGTEATYFDKFGVLRTAQANEPVFEYDPVTKEALGLRRERESFNKMSYSNFNSSYWSAMAGAVVNVNYGLSPDGTVTSNFLTTDATEDDPKVPYCHRRYIQYDAGKDYTSSVFLKRNPNMDESRVIRFVLHTEVYGSPNRNIYFVPATGRVYVLQASAPKNWGYQDCGGGWIRIWMTDTVSADWNNGTGYGPLLRFSNSISQGQGVEWWGMQVEEGVSPTSYIPTDGAAKTRLREEIQYQSEGRIYPSNKATVYLDYTPVFSIPAGTGVNGGFALVIGERSNIYNYLGIDYDNVPLDGRTQSYLRDSSDTGNKGTITAGVKEFGKPLKYACAFSTERVMHSSCNGSSIRSAPNDPVMNSYFELCDRITLFGSTGSGTGPVMGAGWFRKIQIYNEVFEDEKLIEMTTTNSKPITNADSLTINQGKRLPILLLSRGGIESESNPIIDESLLSVTILGRDEELKDKYFRIAYLQNGATLPSGQRNGIRIEESGRKQFIETGEVEIIHSTDDEPAGYDLDRGGIQTFTIIPANRPGMAFVITMNVDALPPSGTQVQMGYPTSRYYSAVIHPSCYLPIQRDRQPQWFINKDRYIDIKGVDKVAGTLPSATTDFIDITNSDEIVVSGRSSAAVALIAFYDKSQKFLDYIGGDGNNKIEVVVKRSNFPVGAHYIKASGWGDPLRDNLIVRSQQSIISQLDKMQQDTVDISCFLREGGYWRPGRATVYPQEGYFYTEPIPIRIGFKFRSSTSVVSTTAIENRVYDQNKNMIGQFDVMSPNLEVTEAMFNSGARYVAFSYRPSDEKMLLCDQVGENVGARLLTLENQSQNSNDDNVGISGVMIIGASLAYDGNSWFGKSTTQMGVVGLNKAISGALPYEFGNSFWRDTLFTPAEFEEADVLAIQFASSPDLDNTDGLFATYQEYTADFDLNVPGNPFRDTYSHAQTVDYILKKWQALCYEQRNVVGSKWYGTQHGKPCRIMFVSHWHDARPYYNDAIRVLAKRWGAQICPFDEKIGFSKNQPLQNGQQVSRLYAQDTQTIDGVVYGWHPLRGVAGEYIQSKMAGIFTTSIRESYLMSN